MRDDDSRLRPGVAEIAWYSAREAMRQEGDASFRRGGMQQLVACAPPAVASDALQIARELGDHDRGYALEISLRVFPIRWSRMRSPSR